MGIFEGCILACDIDDTLMDNGYVNPKNIEKIKYFEDQGGKFVLSTGRGVTALNNLLEQMPDISIAVVTNGCVIYNYQTEEVLYQNEIVKDDYKYVDFISNLGFNVGIEVHSGNKAFTLNSNKRTAIHQEYEKFEAPFSTLENIKELRWNKVLYLFESLEEREKVKEIIFKNKTTSSFLDSCTEINGEMQNYLEQVPYGVSKAEGLKKLCEILNIELQNLFAIGDYFNDIQMLELANISAVPCDSPDNVKKYANYITCSCRDGAVADFIDFLISKFSA